MSVRERLRQLYEQADQENRQTILRLVLPAPGGTLLDVGCGDGSWTLEVASRTEASHVIGLDGSSPLISAASKRGIDARLSELAEEWPLPEHSVDIVHSNQVIEHLSDTDHFFREIRRVLKPGGYAIISTNNLASWHNLFFLILGWQPPAAHVSDEVIVGNPINFDQGVTCGEGSYPLHRRLFTHRALAELAGHHGLTLDAARGAGYYPLPARAARVAARLDPTHAAYLAHRYVAGVSASAAR
ncbi:class I SAM-dependent methyltransferase [Thermoleophilum album]|uniref:Methyltransferase domain-containing protein n=1 Tax=Thermoleophilum album TaxID=29539 RepID=A0A1H6FLF9_THEAL|nr:class I SAM-dependent methyltransferase [Thermoleophilum album]SEH11709.1 Methyltransferase domain-containing protein [Thermoleophilum album]